MTDPVAPPGPPPPLAPPVEGVPGPVEPGRAQRLRSGAGRLWGRTSLRLRLTVLMAVLVAVALGVTSTVGTSLLRNELVRHVDERLVPGGSRGGGFGGGQAGASGGPGIVPFTRDLCAAGKKPSGTEGDFILATDRVVEILDAKGNLLLQSCGSIGSATSFPDLSGTTVARARSIGPSPFTVGSVKGSGRWRVSLVALDDTAGDEVVVASAQSLGDTQAVVSRFQEVQWLMGLGIILLLAAVGVVLVRLSLRPLTDIEATAEAIGEGDLSRRVPEADPRTEVGHLAGALNGMLSQIEAAARDREASEQEARASEQRMRQFIADASHELRTPLTSIRGFAELHRKQGNGPGADVDRSMGRIETEATRMGGLVEDLLLLARLDQDRPLSTDPLDLVPLVADAAFDLHSLGPDRPVDVELPPPSPAVAGGAGIQPDDEATTGPVLVAGDEARLRQVLANLVSNALVHTPAGTPVRLRLAVDEAAHQAVLEVADQGPGLGDDQAARVFERFYRVDKARTRARGGSGLGLSIVASITQAHGGTVEVDTAPGRGACFRVRLPLLGAPTPIAGPRVGAARRPPDPDRAAPPVPPAPSPVPPPSGAPVDRAPSSMTPDGIAAAGPTGAPTGGGVVGS